MIPGPEGFDPPQPGFDTLMHIMCVELGYCGCIKRDTPLHVTILIPSEGPVTADQFVEWVLLADDVNPNQGSRAIKERIRAAFVEHMGAEMVDAARLRWTD